MRAGLDAALDAVRTATGARDAARRDRRRAEARWTLAQRAERRHEAVVSLQVDAAAEGEVDLVLRYRTPCALWRPEHVARLDTAGDGDAAVALETWATAWQATGERWEGVALRFSTARPTASAACPLDEDDVLALRRKTEMERQTVQVSLREQAVQKAGAEGGRDLDEMPGVDDGGEALWLDAPARLDAAERRGAVSGSARGGDAAGGGRAGGHARAGRGGVCAGDGDAQGPDGAAGGSGQARARR
jgi:hypothetical protein